MAQKNREARRSAQDAAFYPSLFAAFLCLYGFLGWFLRFVSRREDEGFVGWLNSSNVISYAVCLALFLGVMVALWALAGALRPSLFSRLRARELSSRTATWLTWGFVAVCFALLLDRRFRSELWAAGTVPQWMPIHQIPKALTLLVGGIGCYAAFRRLRREGDAEKPLVFLCYGLCLLCVFYSLYTANLFREDLYHTTAYTDTIFNVCFGVPYTDITQGVYGHYGLFCALPVKLIALFTGISQAVPIAVALFGALAAAASLYVTHQLLPKNWLRIVGAFAVIYSSTAYLTFLHWMTVPHRVLFPCLLCALFVYLWKTGKKAWSAKWLGVGYGLCALAVLWSTETGIFCLLGWTAFLWCQGWREHEWNSRAMLCRYGAALALCVVSVLAAVGVASAYNLLCGGAASLRGFFFPLLDDAYMNEELMYPLAFKNNAWIYFVLIFLLVMAAGMRHTLLFKKSAEECWSLSPVAAGVGVTGVTCLSYYANRAVYYSYDTTVPLLVIALALALRSGFATLSDLRFCQKPGRLGPVLKRAARLTALFVLVCMALQTAFFPVTLYNRAFDGGFDRSAFEREAEELAAQVPPNVYGAGSGIAFLYEELGWDNYSRLREYSNMYVGGQEAAEVTLAELLTHDEFLICTDTHGTGIRDLALLRDPDYRLVKELPFGNYTLEYYSRLPAATEQP